MRDIAEDTWDRAERVVEDISSVITDLENLEEFLDTLIDEEELDKSP